MRPSQICRSFGVVLLLLLFSKVTPAQHCPPIFDSFLSETKLTPTRDGKLKVHLIYNKMGGRSHEAYQAYMIAFLKSDAANAFPKKPGEIFDRKLSIVLATDLVKKQKNKNDEDDDTYLFDAEVDLTKLTSDLAELRKIDLAAKDSPVEICFAFFIPFLADEKYSLLAGLPEDRHECNYGEEPALLSFQFPQCCNAFSKQSQPNKDQTPDFFFTFRHLDAK